MKRVFLGAALNQHYIEACEQVKQQNANVPGIRWVPQQNLHITTLFIGDVAEAEIENLCVNINTILQQQNAFTLAFEKFVFMPQRKPRMIWLKFKKSSDFARLNLALSHKLLDRDPDHPPKAHITLARFKKPPRQTIILPETDLPTVDFDEIRLYQSILKPGGAEYSILNKFRLKG